MLTSRLYRVNLSGRTFRLLFQIPQDHLVEQHVASIVNLTRFLSSSEQINVRLIPYLRRDQKTKYKLDSPSHCLLRLLRAIKSNSNRGNVPISDKRPSSMPRITTFGVIYPSLTRRLASSLTYVYVIRGHLSISEKKASF